MSKPFVFEKPLGMRDILPELVKQKQHVQQVIQEVFERWGYAFIETPTLEYFDTVGDVSPTMEQKMFKLLDPSGRTLVLRPDFTAPIARVVSSILREAPFPIRLAYQGPVYRAQEKEAGRNAEFPEMGIELIGEEAPDADAEVIALACEALQAVQIPNYKLAIGHVGLIDALFDELTSPDQAAELRRALHRKDHVSYRSQVERGGAFAPEEKKLLLSILSWRGDMAQLEEAEALVSGPRVKAAFQDLRKLWTCLELYGLQDRLMFDLGLISQRAYYTGVFFEIYASGLSFPLGSGGRYDHLLGQFGRPAPATGFTLKIDRLMEASRLPVPPSSRKVLITYLEAQRREAIKLARLRREQGEQVTLHRLPQRTARLEQVDRRFDEWIRLEEGGQGG